jgi:hypothetical protein
MTEKGMTEWSGYVLGTPEGSLGFISAEVKAVADIRILRLGRSVQQFARDAALRDFDEHFDEIVQFF